MFSKAIVKTPCQSMINGLTSVDLGMPDYALALQQHQDYVLALNECGLEVTVLEADENFPDSTFVEDVALMTPQCAILTNPGADSRNGEKQSMLPVLHQFYNKVEAIQPPDTIEAGDIMMVDNHFYIGLSKRTNHAGASQLINILEKYGMTGSTIRLTEVLHLKTGVVYLENNNLLACGEFQQEPLFQQFNILKVDKDEAYAANSVWINGIVLIPDGFPKTRKLIESAGYKTRPICVSEFEKLDGGLSCLSLRF